MEQTQTLTGLATISFYASDHAAAKEWYTKFPGHWSLYERTWIFSNFVLATTRKSLMAAEVL